MIFLKLHECSHTDLDHGTSFIFSFYKEGSNNKWLNSKSKGLPPQILIFMS